MDPMGNVEITYDENEDHDGLNSVDDAEGSLPVSLEPPVATSRRLRWLRLWHCLYCGVRT